MWFYNNVELTEVPDPYIGFVYCITNLINGKRYIGKKNFYSTRRVRQRNKTRRKVVKTESDWRLYFGSNAVLVCDVEVHGVDNFRREVIHLCQSKAEMSYQEIKEQIEHEVLFHPDKFYNNFIGCRIHSKHLKKFLPSPKT